jgi:diadenosine tetraphosphate (Ap4A) HIT family hydrolase
VNRRADWWIRRTTTGCVALLALIAGTVSHLHMHLLVELHGQPGWVAALTPLPVDGMMIGHPSRQQADQQHSAQPAAATDPATREGNAASGRAPKSPA